MKWTYYLDVYPWSATNQFPPMPTIIPTMPKPDDCERFRFVVDVGDPFEATELLVVAQQEGRG